MFIKQISVFLENRKGSLREFTELLGNENINLLALSLADASGFGIARCIVKSNDTDRALALLRENGYIARTNSVVCVRIPNRPMAFSSILSVLEENDVFLEYAYSFCQSTLSDAVILIRPSDKDRCEKALSENGVTMVSQEEVDRF
ncbi:MAG: hypothetical protein IKI49_05940 [Oscillospiraceae bacterium]|nr:hypothetical protein [Oscillospiraceae bacterium]